MALLSYGKNYELSDYNVYNLNDSVRILREVGILYKNIKQQLSEYVKPNTKLIDICNFIETKISEPFKPAFPTGLSMNNIVAHHTPENSESTIFTKNDILKIDFGIHKNGYIIDSAYSITFNNKLKPLIMATEEATEHAIKLSSPDMLLNEISDQIYEVISSFEITLNGKTFAVSPITDMAGHNIEQYSLHAGKLIFGKSNPAMDGIRMKENEIYAIETYASTGTGIIQRSDNTPSHYMINVQHHDHNTKTKNAKQLFGYINKNYKSLPFCTKWLESFTGNLRVGLNELFNLGFIIAYPELVESHGVYTSQHEHTIYLHEYGKEILS